MSDRASATSKRGPAGPKRRAWLGSETWQVESSRRATLRSALTPERLLVLSFAGLIALGTLGFRTLPGLYVGEPLSWLDALFTATSAVCVTGLVVVDTATYFTTLGQAYVLLLIQLGGLGILTLTTAVILALGGRLSLRHRAVSAATAEVAPEVDLRHLIRAVVRFTLVLEAAGALVLFAVWLPDFTDPAAAAWHAVFQAVSAFCNAGFSTFSDSLTGFRTSALTLAPMMALIVLGGLGFIALEDLRAWRRGRGDGRRIRLSLHSRLVFAVSALLLVGGWLLYAVLEWNNVLAPLAPWDRALNALFMSVTARTAGFNTVDHSMMADSTNFLTIVLMSIGGSPGSTAGGLKTTTVAVIVLVAVARMRGSPVTSVGGRTIPEESIQRAVGLFVVGFTVVTGAIFLYAVTHLSPRAEVGSLGFLHFMFEAVSAFNTVGLSMGATGALDSTGKAMTIVLMYAGRVGPLVIAAALSRTHAAAGKNFRYAYEDVIIG